MNREIKKEKKGIKSIKREYVIIGVLVVIALYFVVSVFGGIGGNNTKTTAEKELSYEEKLESRLENVLSGVSGVGKVNVKISVDSSVKNVIATEKTTTGSGDSQKITEKPVLVGGKTVLLEQINPQVVGVIIVAYGADNIGTKTKILNAVITFLNVDSSKIVIINGKK